MTKHRFFVQPQQVKDDLIVISGSDVNHIKNVLRAGIGDELIVSDGCYFEYEVKVAELNSSEVKVLICRKKRIGPNAAPLTLIQAISKGEKMDRIVRQATELGVSAVIPVVTSRTVVRLKKEKERKKQGRWQKIAQEASCQSQRSTIPRIFPVFSWDELLQDVGSFDLVIVFWEGAKKAFRADALGAIQQGSKEATYAVLIGPEGGFSEEEIEELQDRGMQCFSLGRQVLRTETASVVALGIVLYELGRLGDSHA